jgi:DNA helicase-2/ATP-dependent DNA helicase PcrA
MADFENLGGFLEHVALVMDRDQGNEEDRVNIMTMHSAKGLEFTQVFLPGWEEGLFPSQRSLDEKGRSGLEEERRLAYVGITRAKKNLTISFAQNRQTHGLWQNALPSRFIDELPEKHVEVAAMSTSYGGQSLASFGTSRFDTGRSFGQGNYDTPGWKRAEAARASGSATRHTPRFIEGTLAIDANAVSDHAVGTRVFHQKFGYGTVTEVEGNKLTVDFEKAGEKRVLDSFVETA